MTKRSFLLTAAAGLLASIAFAAPSHAGTVYTVDTEVFVTAGTATGATVNFNQPVTAPLSILYPQTSAAFGTITGTGFGTDTLTFSFSNSLAAPAGPLALDFTIMSTSGLAGLGGNVKGSAGVQGGVVVLAITSGVPEPASMALLGIGVTGLLAFRRFFKRGTPVA